MRDASFQLFLYTSKIWVYCSSSSKQELRQWATCKGELFFRQSGKHVRENPDEQTGCDIFPILSGSNGPGDLNFDLVSKEVAVNVKQVVGKSLMDYFWPRYWRNNNRVCFFHGLFLSLGLLELRNLRYVNRQMWASWKTQPMVTFSLFNLKMGFTSRRPLTKFR